MKGKFLRLISLAVVMGATALMGGCGTQTQTSGDVEATTETVAVGEEKSSYNLDENKKAILVVSFGTSYNETREATIGAIEQKIAEAYPDCTMKRAFTSQTIIDKLKERDGEEINNVTQAVEELLNEGYGTVAVQPTHVMNGEEYEEMKALIAPYENEFINISYGTPLLTSSEDYEKLVNAIAADIPQIADKSTAVVLMGHGTEHYANSAYAALDYRFKAMGYENVFVGTVEAYPDFEKVKADVAKTGVDKVVLAPLMIVAGDHATNDMAGDEEDSWKTQFKKEGYEVECLLKGLGEYTLVQDMFVEHCGEAINGNED